MELRPVTCPNTDRFLAMRQVWLRRGPFGSPGCGKMVVVPRPGSDDTHPLSLEHTMSKRARKRRSRKGNAANHGRKPNA